MFARQLGLSINQKKTEVMMMDVPTPSLAKMNGECLAGSNIRNRLNKERNAFRMLFNM